MPTDPNQPARSGVIDVPVSAPTASSLTQQTSATNASPQSESTASADVPVVPRSRRWLIYATILASAALAAVAIAVLYLQWWRSEPRNSLIIVWGQPSWEGATAEVTGPALPAGALTHVLTKDGDFLARFHVPAGIYLVRVYRTDGHGNVVTLLASKQRELMRPLQPDGIWWPFRAPPGVAEMGLDR